MYEQTAPNRATLTGIENAVQHGRVASLKDRKGMVTVKIKKTLSNYNGEEQPAVCVEVIDYGLGITDEKLKGLREDMRSHENIPTKHVGKRNKNSDRFSLG